MLKNKYFKFSFYKIVKNSLFQHNNCDESFGCNLRIFSIKGNALIDSCNFSHSKAKYGGGVYGYSLKNIVVKNSYF